MPPASLSFRESEAPAPMLQAIRRGSRSWFGIILAVILIPPFAVVGIDYVFRGGLTRSAAVISVGDAEIVGTQFEREYRSRVNDIQQRFKSPLDFKTVKQLGLLDRIVEGIVTRLLYQQAATTFKILVSDAVVRQDIFSSRAFRGVSGEFDRGVFQRVLRDAGLTEAGYIEGRRIEIASAFLLNGVRAVGALPKAYVDRIYAFRNQTRQASMVVVPAASITDAPAPTDAQLAAYHKAHAKKYTAPQYRTLTAIVVRPQDVAGRIKIDDAALKADYERRKHEFTTPEKRKLEQIVIADEATAKKAREALLGGRSFETVAKEIAKKPVLSLGTVTKDALPIPALRDAAFKVGEGQVTEPVKSPLGWHIVRVIKVEPEAVKPFDEVKDQIRTELMKKRATPIITDLRNQVDDSLGGGLKLPEIAKRLKLKLYQVPAIDRQGKDKAGKTVADLPARGTVVAKAFGQKPGAYLEVVDLENNGGFYVVAVDKVTPAALRPLASIRDQVAKDWTAAERGKLAKAKAEAIAKQVRGGRKLAEVAEADKLQVAETKPLSRYGDTGDKSVSKAVRTALFRADKTGAVVVAASDNGWAVAQVTKIDTPKAAKDDAARTKIVDAMKKAYGNELFAQFDAYLRQRFPIEIDADAIEALFTSQN